MSSFMVHSCLLGGLLFSSTGAFLYPPHYGLAHDLTAVITSRSPWLHMSSLDYEYIPPNEKDPPPFQTDLPSTYPPGTPAALRGEAVRSALRSTRCLAWDFGTSRLANGWIQVEGRGTLDFLNNKFSQSFLALEKDTTNNNNDQRFHHGPFQKACLLNAKGKVVDQICIAQMESQLAYLLTSPGHGGAQLYNRLDPLIFPMDQVQLTHVEDVTMFTVASTQITHVQAALTQFLVPLVGPMEFPISESDCVSMSLPNDNGGTLFLLPHTTLPTCACRGYTLVWVHDTSNLRDKAWKALVGDENPNGPIAIGPLEYETLRIEAGWPAYGKELTGNDKNPPLTSPNPLELHWQSFLNLNKGCYLGQEGIASVLKNKRGPPRLLYGVVFDDEGNVYNHQSEGEATTSNLENLTVLPAVGQELFVLGSNEQISVGTLTSVAEPGGTGDSTIVGLALARRADSILRQMKEMDLELSSSSSDWEMTMPDSDPMAMIRNSNDEGIMAGSGIIAPPPLDPLDGLEVIVGGTFTVGTLQMVPSRRYPMGQNMFETVNVYEPTENEGSIMGFLNADRQPPSLNDNIDDDEDDDDDDFEKAIEEAAKAEAEATAAAAEAQRKADKLEILKRRAEEAMARRRKKEP